jgi:DNA-binding transcriptional MerR regulator
MATDAIDRPDARTRGAKSPGAFRTISEVSTELEVPQHVLRFWESKFSQLRPLKRGGGRRYYRPEDVELIRRIHTLLYQEGYTIKGVQRLLRGRRPDDESGDAPEKAGGSDLLAQDPAEDRNLLAELAAELRAIRDLLRD